MFPHLLMLGLIEGATVGMVVTPPATYEELGSFGIEKFYVVDYAYDAQLCKRRRRRRDMSAAQYQELRRLCAIHRRSRLKSLRDRAYERELMREFRQKMKPQVRRAG